MRILRKPKVYLIARPQIVEEGLQEFLSEQGLDWPTPTEGVKDAERLVEMAGRCCYASFGSKAGSKTNHRYIQNLLGRNEDGSFKSGPAHGSVTEHANWSFLISGASRSFSHEVVRHRVGIAFSQLSTRFVGFEDQEEKPGTWYPSFVIPPMAQLSKDTEQLMEKYIGISQQQYKNLLQAIENDLKNNKEFMDKLKDLPEREAKRTLRKAARGAARDILPIASEALMTITMNARTIWNTVGLRANEHAEGMIRYVFVEIAKLMEKEMPALFNGLEYIKVWDGSEAVVMPREKL